MKHGRTAIHSEMACGDRGATFRLGVCLKANGWWWRVPDHPATRHFQWQSIDLVISSSDRQTGFTMSRRRSAAWDCEPRPAAFRQWLRCQDCCPRKPRSRPRRDLRAAKGDFGHAHSIAVALKTAAKRRRPRHPTSKSPWVCSGGPLAGSSAKRLEASHGAAKFCPQERQTSRSAQHRHGKFATAARADTGIGRPIPANTPSPSRSGTTGDLSCKHVTRQHLPASSWKKHARRRHPQDQIRPQPAQ